MGCVLYVGTGVTLFGGMIRLEAASSNQIEMGGWLGVRNILSDGIYMWVAHVCSRGLVCAVARPLSVMYFIRVCCALIR